MANDSSGIMALPMTDQQQAAPNPAASPDAQMVFESMRQNLSPKEISDELLTGASQVDPQAVAEFKAELDALDVPPEILDLLDRLVDEVLANPENYEAIKEKYRAQGVTEDVLPEEFDPEFFGALNLALQQVRGEPAGPQAFAQGGLAELKPIAQAIASYGRNGDTMLAHITPAEARMLKKRGGSGTINPVTGLPEFANIFSKIGRAAKKFARSTVGRIVIGTALFMVAGPAAAGMLGVTSAAGVAAVSGFVAGAGSTLLAGGNLRDALKAGAIGGVTAGAMQGIQGGEAAFRSAPTPGAEAASAAGTAAPSLPSAPSLPTAEALPTMPGSTAAPVSAADPLAGARFATTPTVSATPTPGAPFELAGRMDLGAGTRAPAANVLAPSVGQTVPAATTVPAVTPVSPPAASPAQTALSGGSAADAQIAAKSPVPTVGQSIKTIGEGLGLGQGPASWETFKEGVSNLFSPSGASQEAINAEANRLVAANPRMPYDTALKQAAAKMTPSMLRSYGPAAAAGLGIMGLAGGFRTQPAAESPLSPLLTGGPGSATDLLMRNPIQYYIQYLPGVGYQSGRPGFAQGGIVDVPAFANGGKVLSAAQKIELANALVAAQQSDNFTAFNKKISDMGLTQADLLSNFPAINQAGITEAISEGAVVPSASTSNTSSSNTSSSSSSSTSNSTSSANDYGRAAEYFRLNPDVRNAYETQVRGKGSNPMTAEQYMDYHYNTLRLTGDAPGTVRQGYVAAPGASGASSPSASASYSGTATGKTLTTAEKFALADVLTKAQQSGNYDPFNAEIQRLGLTQADLLANFPNINQTGIQEHTGRGVVTPMYKGDVATGVRGLTEGQRTQLGNVFLKAQETGDYGEFNRLLSLYQLQPADLVKLYPNLSLEKIQQFQRDQAGKVTFPAPRVDKVFGVGTAAPTQVEVPSATLRTGQRPTDARSESIRQYLGGVGPGAKIESIVSAMDRADISPEQVADVMGMGFAPVQAQYYRAKNAMILGGYDVDPATGQRIPVAPAGGIAALPAAQQVQPYGGIMSGMMPVTEQQKQFLGQTLDRARESGNFVPLSQATSAMGLTQPDILYNWPGVTPELLGAAAGRGFQVPGGLTAPTVPPVLQRTPVEFMPPKDEVEVKPTANKAPTLMNMGGIADLAQGGYPRRTGQISGPGTETSDSIPAMLSDGEFVMTARAVRGAGNGDRRKGAKKMYALMHRLEKNAARG